MVMIIGRGSDVNAYFVFHDALLYSVLDTVVISGKDVCCSAMFGNLVSVSQLSAFVIRVAHDVYYYLVSVINSV